MIGIEQTLSTEYRYLDADKPEGEFRSSSRGALKLEYSADHLDGHFYIRTNLEAKNFKLVRAPIQSPGTGALGGGRPPSDRCVPAAVRAVPKTFSCSKSGVMA